MRPGAGPGRGRPYTGTAGRGASSVEVFPPVNYPVGGTGTPSNELYHETLLNTPILIDYYDGLDPNDCNDAICFFDNHSGRIQVLYSEGNGKLYVTAALTRYYAEMVQANTGTERLQAIAKVIRALHVIHAFRDANGRLNIMLLLNKFLIENGFMPVILPHDPEVFGGSYSIDDLVTEIVLGMRAFREAVRATHWI